MSKYGRNAKRILKELLELDYTLAEKSFSHFYKAAWPVLEPSALLPNWHQDVIAEYLQATLTGQIKRLIINMPPRYSKSLEVTVMFPAWTWISRPELRFINASYAGDLAKKHATDRRTLIESDWYQAAWADRFALADDQNQKGEYSNDKRGHCMAVGMLGAVTGKGGDYVIIDDPHNPKKAESALERKAAVEAFDSTFTTRLDDKKTGRIIVVMQRLHDEDLSGHLLAQGGWEHLKLPAEAPEKTRVVYPISGKVRIRDKGEILHPKREGKVELAKQKVALGSYNYAGQYDQNPTPRQGGILKKSYWQYYDKAPDIKKFDQVLQSWDMTFKDLTTSDFVVGQVWGSIGAQFYLLDQFREQAGFSATCAAVEQLSQKWPTALKKLVEAKANGDAVVDALKKKIMGLTLVEPHGSKEERVAVIEPVCEARQVWFPSPELCPWISINVAEAAAFPRGTKDDTVDAMSQGINRLMAFSLARLQALSKR